MESGSACTERTGTSRSFLRREEESRPHRRDFPRCSQSGQEHYLEPGARECFSDTPAWDVDMNKRFWLAAAVAAASLCGDRHDAAAQTRPPNVLIIVADDMGYADIGVHGSRDIPTPNIDSLAAGGTRFTNAYVSGPYCSPTRAGLMTGRYPQRFGHEFNIGVGPLQRDHGLPLSERTLADR